MCGKQPDGGPGNSVVIPAQNKDVCRICDKALWFHKELQTHFKWCKGCKCFRSIPSFSQKPEASKCNCCRERGRKSYLNKKLGKGEGSEVDCDGGLDGGLAAGLDDGLGGGLEGGLDDGLGGGLEGGARVLPDEPAFM